MNDHEARARLEKAQRLTTFLHPMVERSFDGGAIYDLLLRMPPEWWSGTARLAGVKAPSEQTIALTVQSLRDLHDSEVSDPFQGIARQAPPGGEWGR